MSPPTGEDPQRGGIRSFRNKVVSLHDETTGKQRVRGGSFPTKSSNGLTPTITSQRMTSCTLSKTEPVGDALQWAVPQPTDDDIRMEKEEFPYHITRNT